MRTRIAIFLAVAVMASGAAFVTDRNDPAAAGMDAARLARIEARMQKFVDDGKAAGFVALVARHGHVATLTATGFQDREKRIPMRTDSIFQIMSMTKPVTCTGVMILMEEGRLALIDPVEKYLPEFAGQKLAGGAKPARLVTIRDLMTHTSGLPGGTPKGYVKADHTLAEVVSLGSQQPLEFEPGTKWSYSNMGIATLGRIIEVVSGKPYEEFITERIFSPLNMKDTHFFLPAAKHVRLAVAYTEKDGKLERFDADPFRSGAKYPGPEGGLYSTASDMACFYQMMLDKGILDGHRILSPTAVAVMTTVHTGELKAGFAPGMGWGLGWSVVREPAGMLRLNSMGSFGHGGAYRTYGWVDPAKDMLQVLMYQRTNGGGDVADEINSFLALAAAAIER
ncbi:MAG: serine hydrolase domain-containing protein [Bryobacteraceae bacterium]